MVDHSLTGQLDALYEATVYDQDGDKIGGVSQVYLDDRTNEPNWATVSTGWFGTKETFVPLDDATLSGKELRVPYTKGFVKDAPNIDADAHIAEAQEAELYRYYSKDYDLDSDTAGSREHDVRGANLDRDTRDADGVLDRDGSVVRHEEELHVGKERVATGRMRLRKHVVTEQKTVTVPVEREEYTLEREPIRDGDVRGGELGEDEVAVTVHEERPVVEKDVVAKERVGLGKKTVTDQQQVTTDVSKEEVEVDTDRDVRPDNR